MKEAIKFDKEEAEYYDKLLRYSGQIIKYPTTDRKWKDAFTRYKQAIQYISEYINRLEPIKQKKTNITFRSFSELYDKEERDSYQARVRYLELLQYTYFETEDENGYYICSTTGIHCLNKSTRLFDRVSETKPKKSVVVEDLTYYEPNATLLDTAIPVERITQLRRTERRQESENRI